MAGLCVRPLDESTWPDFAQLAEGLSGVWGGCWCMAFHAEGARPARTAAQNRRDKEIRVREGRAHAALVYDDEACVGWCQFGSADELPRIKNRREYSRDALILPDWRITCFYVDGKCRHRGIAYTALEGALDEIARLGGGTVESYPQESDGRSIAASFLYNGTVTMFESKGFERTRRLGRNHWVVTKRVGRPPARV